MKSGKLKTGRVERKGEKKKWLLLFFIHLLR
jgi:hypothetical protein